MHRLALSAACLAAGLLVGCDAGTKPTDSSVPVPEVRFVAPRMDAVFPMGVTKERKKGPDGKETDETIDVEAPPKIEVLLDLQNYVIGKVEDGGNGQHLHLILDDRPYDAIYDAAKAIVLDAKLLTKGTHVLRAFPSAGPNDGKGASHHESRKNAGAFAWVRFHVGSKGGTLFTDFDPKAPLLTYSRPKGTYTVGSPEHGTFMVDWFLSNTSIEKGGNHIVATLDGKKVGDWFTWAPQLLADADRPAPGDHTLKLELLDRDDKPVAGPFNATERAFKVVEKK